MTTKEERRVLKNKLEVGFYKEPISCNQKMEIGWVKEVDANTKLFHNIANNTRNKNLVSRIFMKMFG